VLFLGDDWAEAHHDIEIEDEAGRVLARRRLPEGLAGITMNALAVLTVAPTPDLGRRLTQSPAGSETVSTDGQIGLATATRPINGAATLTIEVIQPTACPPSSESSGRPRQRSPHPPNTREVASAAMRLLAEAFTTLTRIRESRRL
jgi:hypothetical protein